MKIENLIFIKNRLFSNSTQIYFEDIPLECDEFYVPVGNYTKLIGFLKFKKIARKGCFELSELVSLDYPNPNPQFSLSGVLYSRQKAIEAHQSICAYQQAVSRLP
ncbi:hypothetical protein CAT59_08095 [Acinetobacter pittii]|uniref:Uncharacterized protein n=1 Tax=Acinetobacter pittii TaxID=48296 RepID=A0A242U656_ACIPI|nr:hypothetical protein CAT59_08095 [Acinetobacter pittii]